MYNFLILIPDSLNFDLVSIDFFCWSCLKVVSYTLLAFSFFWSKSILYMRAFLVVSLLVRRSFRDDNSDVLESVLLDIIMLSWKFECLFYNLIVFLWLLFFGILVASYTSFIGFDVVLSWIALYWIVFIVGDDCLSKLVISAKLGAVAASH